MTMHTEGRLADPERSHVRDFCPIERAISVVGTRSAMVLMREASYGTTRFDDFVTRTGLTDAVTASRLKDLVQEGLLAKEPYREPGQRTRQAYVLTESGSDLLPALVALAGWGSKHLPRPSSLVLSHRDCDEPVAVHLTCAAGHDVPESDLVVSA